MPMRQWGMSILIDLTRLGEALADFDHAYLMTVSGAGDVKVNTVDPVVTPDGLVLSGNWGVQARENVALHPNVTLVWPPRVFHGHTLIVDGTATATDATIVVAPAKAILHRPADHADGPAYADRDTCVQDCRNV